MNYILYDKDTGKIHGTFGGTEKTLLRNLPEECDYIEGTCDPNAKRVDLKTRELVDIEVPSSEKRHLRMQINEQIDELERKALRPQRELSINPDDVKAKERVKLYEQQIADLRAVLATLT